MHAPTLSMALLLCLYSVFAHIFETEFMNSLSCTPHTDVRDKDNQTPLHIACNSGSIEVVRYLVEERKRDIGELLH